MNAGAGRRGFDLAVLALVAVVLGLPLFSGRVLAGHDVRTYLMYTEATAANAREGTFLPAWASELNGGYGGPGLLFYPPLVNAIHAVGSLSGLPAALLLSLLAVAAHFLSGVTARWWLRASGDADAALPAAIVYMAAPYRLVDLYERTDLAEHWAFVFPPLVLGVAATSLAPAKKAAISALALAALALANLPLAILFGALFCVWYLHPAGPSGSRAPLALGAALGAGLALFALVPQALTGRWVATEMWYSGESRLFRPSENTLVHHGGLNDPFATRVSWSVVLTVALLVAAFVLARRDELGRKLRSLWFLAGAAAFLFTLPPAGPLWDATPVLQKLQFPWRLAAPMTLALAGLAASVPRTARLALAAGTLFCALPFLGRLTTPLESAVSPRPAKAALGTGIDERALVDTAALADNAWVRNPKLEDVWYLPRTLRPPLFNEIYGDGRMVYPTLGKQPAASISEPAAPARVVSWTRTYREVRLASPLAGAWVFRALYFPGFAVTVDGHPA
ncbi:MAG TPA: hypothetical protein VGR00_09950, partial [Thermoanaerobaculia bacterium]|nr:hypothetical protein [Thermoanaerobaculia bacterium]